MDKVAPTAARTVDVLVVGAGPAGVAAAIDLHRAGRDVLVVDKAIFPRDKCCGDGLTTLALRELEHLGFRPDTVPSFRRVDRALLRGPSGREVTLPLPRGVGLFAAVTPRLELDNALVDLAVASGVTVLQGHGLKQLEIDGGGARAGVEGLGTVTARHVVAADGMWSPARKALGLNVDGYLGEWHAFRQYVDGVTGPAADRLIVWFDEDFLPGYAWSFPLPDGRANVGFGIRRGAGRRTRDMGPTWARFFERPHVAAALGPGATPVDRHLAWPIPARIDTATLATGPVLFAGDAAGATDVMTGEGIGQALLTGRLAAAAIIAGGDVARAYRHTVRGRAGGRPPHVGVARARARPPARRRRGDRAPRPRRVVGAAQLRPLDVRGRAAGDPRHAPPLAPPLPASARRLRLTRLRRPRWPRTVVLATILRTKARRPASTTVDAVRTRLTELLGIEHPIMLAGMGGVSYHRLVAAVSAAGGIGTLGASTMRPGELAAEMAAVRAATSKPFGVDLLTALPGQVEAGPRRRDRRRGEHLRRRARRAP